MPFAANVYCCCGTTLAQNLAFIDTGGGENAMRARHVTLGPRLLKVDHVGGRLATGVAWFR